MPEWPGDQDETGDGGSLRAGLPRNETESVDTANRRWNRRVDPNRARTRGKSVRELGGRRSTQSAVPAGRLQQKDP
jgi:hypothetical protein